MDRVKLEVSELLREVASAKRACRDHHRKQGIAGVISGAWIDSGPRGLRIVVDWLRRDNGATEEFSVAL